MAKRFIDTGIFNDEWFCDLSQDGKLFFVYYITQCDHAGVLRLNKKLCEFQSGIKDIDSVIEELGNSLVTVKEGLYFMPKYIKFQYPNFPQSSVKQQSGAITILEQLGLWDRVNNCYLTVAKELYKGHDNVNVTDNNLKGAEVSEEEIEIASRLRLSMKSMTEDEIITDVTSLWTKFRSREVRSIARLCNLSIDAVTIQIKPFLLREIGAGLNDRGIADLLSHFSKWMNLNHKKTGSQHLGPQVKRKPGT